MKESRELVKRILGFKNKPEFFIFFFWLMSTELKTAKNKLISSLWTCLTYSNLWKNDYIEMAFDLRGLQKGNSSRIVS